MLPILHKHPNMLSTEFLTSQYTHSLWERSVLIISTKSSAVVSVQFYGYKILIIFYSSLNIPFTISLLLWL